MKKLIINRIGDFSYPVGVKFETSKKAISRLVSTFKTIDEFKGKNINIFCMGSSGAIIATVFAMKVSNCKIVMVRKSSEHCHSNNYDLHKHHSKDAINVIVDDFIDTGNTINSIYNQLKMMINRKIKIHCVAIMGFDKIHFCDFEPDYFISRKT